MEEYKIVLIITAILLACGIISAQFSDFESSGFNFFKSEISINGTRISETLYFKPDQQYHTLFRNFIDPITTQKDLENSIKINSLSCSQGEAYVRTQDGVCYNSNIENTNCLMYTENNEYGCTFGDKYGFLENKIYTIKAEYEINPSNLFTVNGKTYIKFVVYSPNNHKDINSENFIISSNLDIVKKSKYSPSENVIIYIPYKSENKNTLTIPEFQFDPQKNNYIIYFLTFIPALVFFFTWLIFGRERTYADIPEQLSMMPDEKNKRKPWQVAAFFTPPFSTASDNFFSSTLLDFYHRKIIDIKEKDKKIYVKINKVNKSNQSLDEIETKILGMLQIIKENISEKFKDGEYFLLDGAKYDFFNFSLRSSLTNFGRALRKDLNKKSKDYVSKTGVVVAPVIMMIITYITFVAQTFFIIPLFFITLFLIVTLASTTAIFTQHKKDYYKEYQHWKSFKQYLKNSFTIRTGTHKTIVMWEDYLIYATALGVPKRVIDELKTRGLITETQANLYMGVHASSSGFSATSGAGG
ncbi:MAG: DUF2207 domain-containing protein, partial [archaeon]